MAMDDAGIVGATYADVLCHRKLKEEGATVLKDWFELSTDRQLPPTHESLPFKLSDWAEPGERRGVWQLPPYHHPLLRYDRAALDAVAGIDLMASAEIEYDAPDNRMRRLIVSPRLYQLWRAHGVPWEYFRTGGNRGRMNTGARACE